MAVDRETEVGWDRYAHRPIWQDRLVGSVRSPSDLEKTRGGVVVRGIDGSWSLDKGREKYKYGYRNICRLMKPKRGQKDLNARQSSTKRNIGKIHIGYSM